MNTSTPSAASSQVIDDLYHLTLTDGLPAETQGKIIRYRVVRLREIGVAHERAAVRQAERVMMVGGAPKLLVSESEFQFALTTQYIESFECDGQRIHGPVIDVGLVGKLSSHDFALIEKRVFLLNLAAELRYGNITQKDFDDYLAGQKAPDSPQPVGQAADQGARALEVESGPSLLADYAGPDSNGPARADGV